MPDSRLKAEPVHPSMVERPLPFFGAGADAGAIVLFLIFGAINFFGLVSWAVPIAIILSVAFTYWMKEGRKNDTFGPESFVAGLSAPKRFKKSYHVYEDPCQPYNSRPQGRSN